MMLKKLVAPFLFGMALSMLIPAMSMAASFFTVDDSGNMGLGTSSPLAKLDVIGAIYSRLVSTSASTTSTTINWNAGNVQKVTLGSNTTFTFANAQSGGIYKLITVQDGTGGRTITWPASIKWAGGSAPTLSTGANSTDVSEFVYDGTNYLGSTNLNYNDGATSISFDSNSNNTFSNVATGTLSHTTSGTNRMLVVSINTEGNIDPTSVTYNGVAMTKAASITTPYDTSVWYLIAPATGTHDIQAVFSSAQYFSIMAVSLNGTNQSTGIGATNTNSNSGSVTSASVTLSTTAADSWIVDALALNTHASPGDKNPTATGSNQTRRNATYISSNYFNGAQSTETTTNTGSYTSSYSWSGADAYSMTAVEILAAH